MGGASFIFQLTRKIRVCHCIYIDFIILKFIEIVKFRTFPFWGENPFVTHCTHRRSHRRCPIKKVFLNILQNSEENTCARVYFLIKLQKFLRTPFLQNTFRQLLPYSYFFITILITKLFTRNFY